MLLDYLFARLQWEREVGRVGLPTVAEVHQWLTLAEGHPGRPAPGRLSRPDPGPSGLPKAPPQPPSVTVRVAAPR